MPLSLIANLGTGILSTAYAITNRHGKIKDFVKNKFPKIGKVYEKISPTIEHFMYGYAVTTLGYAIQEGVINNEFIKESILSQNPDSPVENYGLIGAGFVTAFDFSWELKQNIERKKFQPAQFIGTCAGVLTGIAVNNLEKILK